MKRIFISTLVIAVIFMTGCKKSNNNDDVVDIDDNVVIDKNYNSKEFFKEFSVKQAFNVNTTELPKTLTLKGGTKVTIKPGTFTKNGTPITGAFTVELQEMLKRSDIIFSGTNTNHVSGQYLDSDGFIYIDVKQDGVSVDQTLAANLKIEIPKDAALERNPQLWEGAENIGEGEDQFGWNDFPKDGVNFNDREGQDFDFGWANNTGITFEFSLGKLGWFNCDIYWAGTNPTTVYVTLTGYKGNIASYQGYSGDTFVFFCGKGDKVIAQLYTPHGEGVQSYVNSMPLGKIGKLIAFAIKEGKFYYASKDDVTITEDLTETLDLQESTKEHIQAQIEALDNFN
jgi:hypothetical protein